jgi:hypothetical protein
MTLAAKVDNFCQVQWKLGRYAADINLRKLAKRWLHPESDMTPDK